MKINDLPIYMLSSFGHAEIDWTHSLLDSHKDILIMPAFSFFRTLHKIEKINKIKLKKLDKASFASKILSDMFFYDESYKVKRRKFLFNLSQKEIFEKSIINFYKENNLTLIPQIFFAIHYAFCETHNIDFTKKKCIVSHEHVSWHFKKYKDNFNAKSLLIFRDPRAVLGGGILRMKNSNASKTMNSLQMDTMLLTMLSAINAFKHHKKATYILTNETMHVDLRKEMKKLSTWMQIDFQETMLLQTFMNKEWKGESSYLAKDELDTAPPNNYYDPFEVEKRWKSVLTDREVLSIEVIFKKFIQDFGYDFKNKINFKNKFKGLIYFFKDNQFQEKYFFSKYLVLIRNLIRRLSVLILKENSIKYFDFK